MAFKNLSVLALQLSNLTTVTVTVCFLIDFIFTNIYNNKNIFTTQFTWIQLRSHLSNYVNNLTLFCPMYEYIYQTSCLLKTKKFPISNNIKFNPSSFFFLISHKKMYILLCPWWLLTFSSIIYTFINSR